MHNGTVRSKCFVGTPGAVIGGWSAFVYIQAIQGYLGTAIGPVFVLAVFWKRATEAVSKIVIVVNSYWYGPT